MNLPKVKIQLRGEDGDIAALKSCYFPPGCEIISEDNFAYLILNELDSSLCVDEIKMQVEDFLDRMNGVARVVHPDYHVVSIGQILTLRADGKYDQNILLPMLINRNVFFEHALITDSKPAKPFSQILVEASYNDPLVREVLHYFNSENWVNLYKIYELIRYDVKTSKLIEWSSGNIITRFRLTAQSKKLIGDESRHADPSVAQPDRPMSIEEASILIRTFLRKWISSKMPTE